MRRLMFKVISVFLITNLFLIISSKELSNESSSFLETDLNHKFYLSQNETTFQYQSEENVFYNITIGISAFKLKIKIYEFGISTNIYKNKYSFADLFFLNNYFRIFNSIDEIYRALIELLKNEIKIITHEDNIDLIIYINNSFVNNIEFSNIKKTSNVVKEKIEELYQLIDELKFENIKSEIKINECMNEISRLNKELDDLKKDNVLLISDNPNSILKNLLQISPYENKISSLPSNYIIPRLKENIMNNFKIIIYDLKDCGFGIADDINEMKKYLDNGGNILVTHDQWFDLTYKGRSYELFNAIITPDRYLNIINKAKIINDEHPVFSSFYQLNKNDLKISKTHRGFNKYLNDDYLKDMIIEVDDNHHTEYLMIKKYGKGKIIFWNAGHEPSLTDFEEKLFINIISWVYKDE